MATDIYALDYKVENVVIWWLCIALAFQYKVTKSLVNVLDLFCDLSQFTCSYFIYNLIVSTLFLSPQVRDYIHVVDLADGHIAAVNKLSDSSVGM